MKTVPNRIIAAMLALMFGGLGIHKFYIGKSLQGFLSLLFCWTFIPGIIAFVECIKYLMTSDEDWALRFAQPETPAAV